MELTITEWNDHDSRGRAHAHGKAALIAQAYPGDTLIAHIDKGTRGTLQGRVSRIVTPSPDRLADHPCRHVFRCTGCAFVALKPERESELKADRIRGILDSIDPQSVQALRPLLRPTEPFYYRHYAKQIVKWQSSQPVIGAYVMNTHQVVDNTDCPVLTPDLSRVMQEIKRGIVALSIPIHREANERLMRDPEEARADRAERVRRKSRGLRDHGYRRAEPVRHGRNEAIAQAGVRYVIARQSQATSEVLVLIVTSSLETQLERQLCRILKDRLPFIKGAHLVINTDTDSNALLAGSVARVAGDMTIHDTMLGYTHRIGPTSFFQVNPKAASVLFQEALQAALGDNPVIESGSACIEAYAGVGALTLPLSEHFARVVAIENSPEAARSLRSTARNNDRDARIVVCEEDVAQALPRLLAEDNAPEVVVLDPPRKGMGSTVVNALAQSKVKRIVLLSCDPHTLRADLPPLLAAGFRIERVVPVDQFPRTHHVETVTCLVRA